MSLLGFFLRGQREVFFIQKGKSKFWWEESKFLEVERELSKWVHINHTIGYQKGAEKIVEPQIAVCADSQSVGTYLDNDTDPDFQKRDEEASTHSHSFKHNKPRNLMFPPRGILFGAIWERKRMVMKMWH